MNKVKILHIQLLPILSGVQNIMIKLLLGLEKEKYDIYVMSRGDGPLADKVKECGWTHIPMNCLVREISFKDFYAFYAIYRVIKKLKPDIVHTHSSKPGFIGRIVARMAKVPLIIHTIHGFSFHGYQNKISWFFCAVLETLAALFAHYNVSVNSYEKELAVHRLGFNKNKTLKIFNGIEPYHKQKIYNDIGNHTLNVVSTLRFSKVKNIIFTVEEAVKIVKNYENVNFTFYGDGELLKKCVSIVEKNHVTDKIIFKGWVYDIEENLLDYDVFLLNSLWEAMSIAILEAMSVGLPIICSNVKGNNELVDESNGWLINPRSVNAIEGVINEILSDKTILIKKGEQSLKKVTTQFNYELFISEYKKLYEKVSGGSE